MVGFNRKICLRHHLQDVGDYLFLKNFMENLMNINSSVNALLEPSLSGKLIKFVKLDIKLLVSRLMGSIWRVTTSLDQFVTTMPVVKIMSSIEFISIPHYTA